MHRMLALALAAVCVMGAALAADEIVIADFEQDSYGAWRAEGEAFGDGPAHGTLPGQMRVTGYIGHGLVNSFAGRDISTGTLTSPPFTIARKKICFLVGGGKYPGKTCINLLVNGEAVRTATGPNDRPGGSEKLDWHCWDVADLDGQEAVIQIVDDRKAGWGHINVDHIIQTNEDPYHNLCKSYVLDQPYLVLPVKNGATMRRLTLTIGDLERYFDIELADGEPDWWARIELGAFQGQTGVLQTVVAKGESETLFDAIVKADAVPGEEDLYNEPLRPQFHFSPARGWTNDPNGLVYYKGEYHLFFQHNPFGWRWGNMHWGHAVSTDLVHWTEIGDALFPDALGTMYSGSAVVDHANTAGFQDGAEKALVCFYTSAGGHAPEPCPFTQSIAYSTDRGRAFTPYAGNPVLGHIAGNNRDPKVLWHAPSSQWVMALYLDGDDFALFGSKDLKSWAKLCDVEMPHTGECPDFFELPVDGDPADTRWVFWGANSNYALGRFDGQTFTREGELQRLYAGGNAYAAQTWSDIPAEDGRRIQIAWLRKDMPGMRFNQAMTVPVVLALRTTQDGLRLCAEPVEELEALRKQGEPLDANALKNLQAQLLDIEVRYAPAPGAKHAAVTVHGQEIRYDIAKQELSCGTHKGKLALEDGEIALRILADRGCLEIFGNQGRFYLPMAFDWNPAQCGLDLELPGRTHVTVYELERAWK